VSFRAESVFERPEDRLDPLTDPGQDGSVTGLVGPGGAQDRRAEALARRLFELAAGVALVADHQLAAVQTEFEQAQRDIALLLVGRRQDRGPRGAIRRGQQMQSHAPKPAAMATAEVVRTGRRELRAARGLNRAATRHRRRVDQHHVVDIARRVVREHRRQPLDRLAQSQPPLPIARLLGQLRDQGAQTLPGDG
jgi:hypothetical protein